MPNKRYETEDFIDANRKTTVIFRWVIAISVFFVAFGFWELKDYHGEFLSQSSLNLKLNQLILLKVGMNFTFSILALLFALGIRRRENIWWWSFSVLGFIFGIVIIWLDKLGYNLVNQKVLLRTYSFVPCMLAALIVAVIGMKFSSKE